jgi:hypothetical protein
MSWYKASLTVDDISVGKGSRIMEDFGNLFLLHQPRNERKQLALFSGGFSRHDVTNLYFSPKCAEVPVFKALIDSYNGIPCSEPTKETEEEMAWLGGAQDSWQHMIWHPDL